MKNLSVLALLLVLSTSMSAQKKVAGFYKGTLFNDSTKMVQQYELALAEYRGKIMGYSYVTFVANDTFYYGIRKINAKIVGDSLVVEDDKMIANNFPEAPAKRVSRTVTIPFNGQDSLVSVNGRWKTNQTKVYYAVPGAVEASKSGDSSGSALFAHLKELNLMPNESNYVATATETKSKQKGNRNAVKAGNNPLVKEEQATPVAINTTTQGKTKTADDPYVQTKAGATENAVTTVAVNSTANDRSQETKSRQKERNKKNNKENNSDLAQKKPVVGEDNTAAVAANTNTNEKSQELKNGQENKTHPETGNNSAVVQTKPAVNEDGAITAVVNTNTGEKSRKTNVQSGNETDRSKQPVTAAVTNAKILSAGVLNYTQRKNHLQQTVEVTADSLVLSFYDNGVVDGDSISVYMNDQLLIGSTKLKSSATKKTVYINGMSEIKLLLVAENMGSIPPNTGLLVVRDGEKTYHVNFTADMQTNAGILLRKR